ncbi:mapeg family protein [Stylonychia lemnae]|uniref:Mapeg family protein n=1 Tax=Stylonychia lemnae TaxID=5949 RepID=A0A078AKF2_STYLE|nr:mapeg family protein [Stylonychia lemnae]|eukprot:CDW82860.1 mapeg family protein [Stylonychia lemnae]
MLIWDKFQVGVSSKASLLSTKKRQTSQLDHFKLNFPVFDQMNQNHIHQILSPKKNFANLYQANKPISKLQPVQQSQIIPARTQYDINNENHVKNKNMLAEGNDMNKSTMLIQAKEKQRNHIKSNESEKINDKNKKKLKKLLFANQNHQYPLLNCRVNKQQLSQINNNSQISTAFTNDIKSQSILSQQATQKVIQIREGSSIVVETEIQNSNSPDITRDRVFKIQSRNSIGAVDNNKTSLIYGGNNNQNHYSQEELVLTHVQNQKHQQQKSNPLNVTVQDKDNQQISSRIQKGVASKKEASQKSNQAFIVSPYSQQTSKLYEVIHKFNQYKKKYLLLLQKQQYPFQFNSPPKIICKFQAQIDEIISQINNFRNCSQVDSLHQFQKNIEECLTKFDKKLNKRIKKLEHYIKRGFICMNMKQNAIAVGGSSSIRKSDYQYSFQDIVNEDASNAQLLDIAIGEEDLESLNKHIERNKRLIQQDREEFEQQIYQQNQRMQIGVYEKPCSSNEYQVSMPQQQSFNTNDKKQFNLTQFKFSKNSKSPSRERQVMLRTDLQKKPKIKTNDLMISMYQTSAGMFDLSLKRKQANNSETLQKSITANRIGGSNLTQINFRNINKQPQVKNLQKSAQDEKFMWNDYSIDDPRNIIEDEFLLSQMQNVEDFIQSPHQNPMISVSHSKRPSNSKYNVLIKMINVTLPKEYPYVMLLALGISLQCYFTGFFVAQPKRYKMFNRQFMNENFGELHKKETGSSMAPDQGYPDMGSGVFSEKLSYKQWIEFNLAQRVHQNFLEQMWVVAFLILVAGITSIQYTLIAGGFYALGRFLMAIGYSRGVEGRKIGVTILNIALGVLVCLAVNTTLTIKPE